jgi:hypothetical protein
VGIVVYDTPWDFTPGIVAGLIKHRATRLRLPHSIFAISTLVIL